MPAWLLLCLLLAGLLGLFTWWARRERSRQLATVRRVTLDGFWSEHLGNSRAIDVFLPPGYERAASAYPVLLVNDGQDQNALGLHETLARLYDRRLIQPIVVVAIPTNSDRLQEYGTAVAPNAQGLGRRATAYSTFVTEELMPHIAATFRTLPGAAFLGASLGGLSAFDIVWNHPDLFQTVGVFSGSFWWRTGPEEANITPNALIAHEIVRRGSHRTPFRAWFQAGTRDETSDRDKNGVIDAIQDTLELVYELEALGYARGRELAYVEIKDGRHNYRTWSAALPRFLRWAYGPGSEAPGLTQVRQTSAP